MTQGQPVPSYFDRQASFWRDVYDAHEDVYSDIHRQRRDWTLATVESQEPVTETTALDLGVGAGGLAVALAARGLRVVGVDRSAQMLELTKALAATDEDTDKHVMPVRADAGTLPFRDDSFPLVIGLGLLPWMDSPAKVLGEMARVVSPGGRVIFSADNSRRLTHLLDPLFNPWLAPARRFVSVRILGRARPTRVRARSHTLGEIRRLCRDAGLEIVDCQPLGFGPFTVLRHRCLPDRAGRTLNHVLQRRASRGAPVLRTRGCQYLVLARRG